MTTDIHPGDDARYTHAECLRLPVMRRCRRCKKGGRPVEVVAVHSPSTTLPRAIVRDSEGREFGAWPSEIAGLDR